MFSYKFQTGLANYYLKYLTLLTLFHLSSFWEQLTSTLPFTRSFSSFFVHLEYQYCQLSPTDPASGILILFILLRSSHSGANFDYPCRCNLCLVAKRLLCPSGRKDHLCVHSNCRTFSYSGNYPFLFQVLEIRSYIYNIRRRFHAI